MADVTRGSGPGRDSASGRARGPDTGRDDWLDPGRRTADDRGQVLLTGAVVIALSLVTLSLVLNSAIFAENLGARGSGDAAGHAAVAYRADVASTTARTLAHVNAHNNSTYVTLHRAFERDLRAWSDLSGRHAAVTAATVNASLAGTTNGTRVRQTNENRALTDVTGQDNWTLVDDTDEVREFDLSVEAGSLVDPPATGYTENLTDAEVFRIAVENDTRSWDVFLYRDGTEFVVATETSPGPLGSTCTETASSGEYVRVNLTGATLDGAPCPELSFFDGVTEQPTIEYVIGANATGTYSLVVDENHGNVYDTNYEDDPTDTGPFVTEMIYGADVRLTYVTRGVTYRTNVSAVPGGGR